MDVIKMELELKVPLEPTVPESRYEQLLNQYAEKIKKIWKLPSRKGEWKAIKKLAQPYTIKNEGHRTGVIYDLGCGVTQIDYLEYLTKNFLPLHYKGIDISQTMLNESQNNAEKIENTLEEHGTQTEFLKADLGKSLPFPDETGNIIICMSVLPFVPNWKFLIEEMWRLVKKDAIVLISTQLDKFRTTMEYKTLKKVTYGLKELFGAPRATYHAVKAQPLVKEIYSESESMGAEHPNYDELIEHIKITGFQDIKELPIFRKYGIALRLIKK